MRMRLALVGTLVIGVAALAFAACANSSNDTTTTVDSGSPPPAGDASHDGMQADGPGFGGDSSFEASHPESGSMDAPAPVDSPPDAPPPTDSGHDAATDSGSDTGSDTGSDAGFDSGSCGSSPLLHPESQPGVYCPFSSADGGPFVTCPAYQECCETPAAAGMPSTCEAFGSACPVAGSATWECEDPIDCAANPNAAGPVCCGNGSVVMDAVCGYYRGSGFQGTACAASCGAGQVLICEANAQCAAGQVCTPFKTKGLQIGTCL